MVLYFLLLPTVKNCIEEDQNLRKKSEHISDNYTRLILPHNYQNKLGKTHLWSGVKPV